MQDMSPSDIQGDFRKTTLNHYDGSQRVVLVTDNETPYPEGKLIVSRTDTNGNITHCNRSFVDMSGYDESEIIGQPHALLRHPDMPAAAFEDLWKTVQNGNKWHGYVKNLRKDGGYYWVYATVIPNVRNGKIVGYTSVRRKPSRKKVEEAISTYANMS
ncbi:MAG TPA: PAS domain S-box protein [Thiolapillus brandeum]|uniref:PAS domain S-box protein n=1 Tax=Thiolapillus brandeum TaxID=1076588 RepID=A0A831W9J3_9GAMM|nr:PAS domain S-box protein [Thiolapillus brandeum]